MSTGFFRMYEATFVEYFLERPAALTKLYYWLCLKAKYHRHQCDDGTWLEPGELIARGTEIAKLFRTKRGKVYQWLEELETIGVIRRERRPYGTKVSVVHHPSCAKVETSEVPDSGHGDVPKNRIELPGERGQPSSIYIARCDIDNSYPLFERECENLAAAEMYAKENAKEAIKKIVTEFKSETAPISPAAPLPVPLEGKKRKPKQKAPENATMAPPFEVMELAERWCAWVHTRSASKVGANVKNYAAALHDILLTTEYGIEDLSNMFIFISNNPFWADRAYSPAGLKNRSKPGNPMKIENIWMAMTGEKAAGKQNLTPSCQNDLFSEFSDIAQPSRPMTFRERDAARVKQAERNMMELAKKWDEELARRAKGL